MAYQLVTDINYSNVVNWQEDEFTVAGPGSLRCIKKCFVDKGEMSNEDIIRYMYEHQDEEFKRLGLDFKKIGNRPLQLIDCQNIFCELDKYCRQALPNLKSNRTKIKKKYVAKQDKIYLSNKMECYSGGINEKSMIELFKGYTNYSEDEYKRIWESAIIVVDTNILLNFYRYSEDTKKEMFKILTNLKDRLWIPYQIAKEYFKNKNNVMVNSYDEYTKLSNSLKDLFDTSIKKINTRKNSQLKCKSEIVKILEESTKRVEELLLKEKEGKKPTFEENKVENKIYFKKIK